jgi:rubrerythrin
VKNKELAIFSQIVTEEQLISEIYMKFSELFTEDKGFWWALAMEEKAHASIAKSIQNVFVPIKVYPKELTDISLNTISDSIDSKKEFMEFMEQNPGSLSRLDAFKKAIEIEESDIEKIYQDLMEKLPSTKADELFQKLNEDTEGHARKIKEYMRKSGFETETEE